MKQCSVSGPVRKPLLLFVVRVGALVLVPGNVLYFLLLFGVFLLVVAVVRVGSCSVVADVRLFSLCFDFCLIFV